MARNTNSSFSLNGDVHILYNGCLLDVDNNKLTISLIKKIMILMSKVKVTYTQICLTARNANSCFIFFPMVFIFGTIITYGM